MNIVELAEDAGLQPRWKAALHGGEYACACPFCKEGDDRFLTWPQRHNQNGEYQGGRFYCRRCEKSGDAITFLRELHGLSYREACDRLRIAPKQGNSFPALKKKNPPPLPVAQDPPALWQERAAAYVELCHAELLLNPEALELVTARGFNMASVSRFKLGYCPSASYLQREDWGLAPEIKDNGKPRKLWFPRGIVIPTFTPDGRVVKVKFRSTDYEAKMVQYQKDIDAGLEPKFKPQKYGVVPGLREAPSVYGDTSLSVALILESELDALLVQQCAADLVYCVALGGSTKPIDRDTDILLCRTEKLLFCPDFDDAGVAAWDRWEGKYQHIELMTAPEGKSPGDALLAGANLREWIVTNLHEIAADTNNKQHMLSAAAITKSA